MFITRDKYIRRPDLLLIRRLQEKLRSPCLVSARLCSGKLALDLFCLLTQSWKNCLLPGRLYSHQKTGRILSCTVWARLTCWVLFCSFPVMKRIFTWEEIWDPQDTLWKLLQIYQSGTLLLDTWPFQSSILSRNHLTSRQVSLKEQLWTRGGRSPISEQTPWNTTKNPDRLTQQMSCSAPAQTCKVNDSATPRASITVKQQKATVPLTESVAQRNCTFRIPISSGNLVTKVWNFPLNDSDRGSYALQVFMIQKGWLQAQSIGCALGTASQFCLFRSVSCFRAKTLDKWVQRNQTDLWERFPSPAKQWCSFLALLRCVSTLTCRCRYFTPIPKEQQNQQQQMIQIASTQAVWVLVLLPHGIVFLLARCIYLHWFPKGMQAQEYWWNQNLYSSAPYQRSTPSSSTICCFPKHRMPEYFKHVWETRAHSSSSRPHGRPRWGWGPTWSGDKWMTWQGGLVLTITDNDHNDNDDDGCVTQIGRSASQHAA